MSLSAPPDLMNHAEMRLGLHFQRPIEKIWTEDALTDRGYELLQWYAHLERDPDLARDAATFCMQSLWSFISTVAWTMDDMGEDMTNKPFMPLPYIKIIADTLDDRVPGHPGRYANKVVGLAKSRDMMASWIMAEDLNYTAIKNMAAKLLIVSAGEGPGVELNLRAKRAYMLLPNWFKQAMKLPSDENKVYNRKETVFPNDSRIVVLPEKGGDKIRSHSPRKVYLDEASFQEYFERTYVASVAKLDSRSQVFMVSTPRPGYYEQVWNDRTHGQGGPGETIKSATGIRVWKNRLNKVTCIRLHYLADPKKRTAEWQKEAFAELPPYAREQEFELKWFAKSGQPIFPMLDMDVHMTKKPWIVDTTIADGVKKVYIIYPFDDGFRAPRHVTLGLAVDHGYRNPCGAILLGVDDRGDQYAIKDYSVAGRSPSANAWAIREELVDIGPGETDKEKRLPLMFAEIDAMMTFAGLKQTPAGRRTYSKTEELYKFEDGDASKPILPMLRTCRKWTGSVQQGIDQMVELLLATLANVAPESPYWEVSKLDEAQIQRYSEKNMIHISPECSSLFAELEIARFKDARIALDQNLKETEVDSHNHVRKAVAYLHARGIRYLG